MSVPSENSDATLMIPPHSWIEYTMWTRRANVTAYHDGKPFYCLKLLADPSEYPFMCKKYDFMAEIVKPEPAAGKYKPMKKRKYASRSNPKPKTAGEGLGREKSFLRHVPIKLSEEVRFALTSSFYVVVLYSGSYPEVSYTE